MKSEVLIPLGIFLVALLIFLAAIAHVLRGVLGKSALAQREIQKGFPWLFERGFQFQSSAGPFASIVAGRLDSGTDVKLHFRLPGRGYTGGVGYHGIQFFLLELSNFPPSDKAPLLTNLEEAPGSVIFQSETQIHWQPAETTQAAEEPINLKCLIDGLREET